MRWRLILAYTLLLAVLLLVLALVLNAVISQVLYTNELSSFQTEAQAVIVTNQRSFDTLVSGAPAQQCADALSVESAFETAIAQPLSQFPGVESVYLLDRQGAVLAPASAVEGQTAPYLTRARIAELQRAIRTATPAGATGYVASTTYVAAGRGGQRTGVVLIAERYRTASFCDNPQARQIGVVEVVTTFPRTRNVLAALRVLLVIAFLGALLAGVLIGGPLIAGALRPLTRMTRAARRIAGGDLSQRVGLPESRDEIGQLAGAFDEMIDRIQVAFAAQQASEERVRQFVSDASHELRTPLTSIRGYVDVLLRGAKDDPQTAADVLHATQREAERMSRLVADLLTLARLDEGRPLRRQPVHLIALAGEAVDQARILAGQREVTLHTDGRGRLMIEADADRLKQVLLILLDNALKYGRSTPDGWVHVTVAREPGAAIIRIADNGRGIAPEDLPHIFDRFYRADRAARTRRMTAPRAPLSSQDAATPPGGSSAREPGGSGLGLAIARAIVQAHGGMLMVQSQLGEGSVFTLRLPLSQPPVR